MIQISGGFTAREAYSPADHNLLGWTFDPTEITTNSALPTAGRLEIIRLKSRAGLATNIVIGLIAAGNTLTSGQCFAALYTSAGSLVAVTADQSTNWASPGLKTMALSGGPYAVDQNDYYVGFWFNGTTGPALGRLGNASAAFMNVGLSAPNFRVASANTGLTTSAPSTIGTQSSTGIVWWAALS